MQRSADSIMGSPTTHIKVAKQEDGTFKAENVSLPQIPAVSAPTETRAIAGMRQATEEFIAGGMGPVKLKEKVPHL